MPAACIVWVNYNSMPIIDVTADSIRAVSRLSFTDYMFILIDNGSSDGSGARLCSLSKQLVGERRTRCIMLGKNLGYAGGCNAGFRYALHEGCEYIIFLNNDASPSPRSLDRILSYLSRADDVAGCQGVLLDRLGGWIDTAGGIIDDMLYTYMYLRGKPVPATLRERDLSYIDGAYAVYRIDVLYSVLGFDPYPSQYFAYYEDVVLGAKLWDAGHRLSLVPVIAGIHSRSTSFKSYTPLKMYLALRNWIASLLLSDSPYNRLVSVLALREVARYSLRGIVSSPTLLLRVIRDAKLLSDRLRPRYAFSLSNIPHISYSTLEALEKIFAPWRLKGLYAKVLGG